MVETAKELLEAITPIDDPQVHAFVEYLDWMKSSDDVDPLDDEEPNIDMTSESV